MKNNEKTDYASIIGGSRLAMKSIGAREDGSSIYVMSDEKDILRKVDRYNFFCLKKKKGLIYRKIIKKHFSIKRRKKLCNIVLLGGMKWL